MDATKGFRTWFRNRLDEGSRMEAGRVRRTLEGWRASPPTGTKAAFFEGMLEELDKHERKPAAPPKPTSEADSFV